LGSTEAINLDGGGSSTLWANTDELNGVLNFPPDNDTFDHRGERKVANAILVVPSK
jgi:exopolysaccharide biosynthesis protein